MIAKQLILELVYYRLILLKLVLSNIYSICLITEFNTKMFYQQRHRLKHRRPTATGKKIKIQISRAIYQCNFAYA